MTHCVSLTLCHKTETRKTAALALRTSAGELLPAGASQEDMHVYEHGTIAPTS